MLVRRAGGDLNQTGLLAPNRRGRSTLLALSFVFGLACGEADAPRAIDERTSSIVYGTDDRRELYEEPVEIRELARNAVLGLIPKARITNLSSGEVRLKVTPLGAVYDLCTDELFREQPTAADCTGVLIDDDLVLTAGHCFEEVPCTDYLYAFDYYYRSKEQLESLRAGAIYGCRKLVAREISSRNGRQLDYAVVQLDRPVPDRKPVSVRSAAAEQDEPLVVIGMGSGLPIKVDSGARVIQPRSYERDYFMLEADTFEGSSGSAILDKKGGLLGVLVRGGEDYVNSPTADCKQVNRLPMAQVMDLPGGVLVHEEATYANSARDGLCASGFPSQRLCDVAPACGDTFCTSGETRSTCAEDCDPCIDGRCGARGSVRYTPDEEVKQTSGSGRAKRRGCALSQQPTAPVGADLALLGLLGVWFARRRRSR